MNNRNQKIVLFGILCVFSMLSVPALWSQEILDGVVAIVGDKMILRSELLQTAQGYALQMGIDPETNQGGFENLKRQVLRNLVDEKVMLAQAVIDTITVEDEQVEAALEDRIQALIRQAGSKERVENYFGTTINKIKRNYREEVRDYLIVQRVQQEKLMGIQVSRHEVITFYETMKDSLPEKRPMVRLRHIMMQIRPGETARQAAMERIQEIRRRLNEGEDFQELARAYSEDPGTASRGGNLGFVERGTLFQSFEEVAFQMSPGTISNVVETPVGLHLIQVVEKRGEQVNVRHILIRLGVDDLDEEAVYNRLADVRSRAQAGEDFGTLASAHSDDESTKEQGGDLGWLPPEELQIEAFKGVVDTLEVGEISLPFKTPYGYHIVKLENRRGAGSYSLDEDWLQIREMALNMKRQNTLREWLDEIKKGMYIEMKEDMI